MFLMKMKNMEHGTWNNEVGYGKLDADRALGVSELISSDRELKEGNYIFEDGTIITNNATVEITENTRFYLLNRAQLSVQENASITIENNVTFLGETTTIPAEPPVIPETIPGNRIEIYGNVTIGTGVEFTVEEDEYWDGLYLLGNQNVPITDGLFNHCGLQSKYGEIQLSGTDFTMSRLSCYTTTLELDGCSLEGSDFGTGIYCFDCPQVSIVDSDVHNYNFGIQLSSCSNYTITECEVYDNVAYGIYVVDTYTGVNEISLTDIYNNGSDGIRFYTSEGTVESCNIYNNYRGILCFHGSIVEILKDPESSSWFDDSVISNNDYEEILFFDDCTVIMDCNRNKIVYNDYQVESYDRYLVRCPDMIHNQVWRKNFWGYYDIHGNAIVPPEERFYLSVIDPDPGETGYLLSPVWDPGQPREGEKTLAETLYLEADSAVSANDYVLADQLFRQVIDEYTETVFSPAAAKRLIEVNDDYDALKDYYETESNLRYDENSEKYADYLANYCNIKLENYEEAILNFEEVISNPPSEIDSVLAIIDLGYTYLIMEESEVRSGFIGNMAELKPTSWNVFDQTQEELLAGLLENPADYQDNIPSEDMIPKSALLYSNYPNPFNPETTISFSIPEASEVNVSIYNIKGQKVKTLLDGKLSTGKHSVVWYGDDELGNQAGSGIYFYQLAMNDKVAKVRKCLLLK